MDPIRAAAVAATFSLGTPSGEPTFVARGSMGELWRLRTVEGRSWALKVLFDWGDEVDPSGPDVALQDAAAAAGVSRPQPRRAGDGRVIVDGVRVYQWVDLVPLPSPPDDVTLHEAGRILGILHALALPPEPGDEVDRWYIETPPPEHFQDLARRGAAAGRRWAAPLLDRLDDVRELCALVRAAPARTDDVIVCHGDLTPDNLFRPTEGAGLVVVDWENAGPLSAEAELAATVAAWCGSSSPDAFLTGYEAGGGTASIAGPASFSMNVATRLNYLRVLADQSLDDAGHRDFADPVLDVLLRDGLDAAVPRGWRT